MPNRRAEKSAVSLVGFGDSLHDPFQQLFVLGCLRQKCPEQVMTRHAMHAALRVQLSRLQRQSMGNFLELLDLVGADVDA